MSFKNNIFYKEGRKYRTLCEVLRQIESENPNSKELIEEATYYAKRMDSKLKEYNSTYEQNIFTKPTKENTKEKRNIIGFLTNVFDMGLQKVWGRINGTVSLILISFTFLQVNNISINIYYMLIFFCVIIISIFLAGLIYYKGEFFKHEVNYYTKANPFYSELLEKVTKIEENQKVIVNA